VTFIHRSLAELDGKLRQRGSCLAVRHGDPRRKSRRWSGNLASTSSCRRVTLSLGR
jgi:deoxyribodipyrimidine photolyase